MRSFSAFTNAALDSAHVDAIRLVRIHFDGLTLRLCSRVFGDPDSPCVFDGEIYEPLLIAVGNIRIASIDPVTFESKPSEATVEINNEIPVGGAERFTELFNTYPPQFSTIEIVEIYSGATLATDENKLFEGNIEDLLTLERGVVEVSCVGFELDTINRFLHTVVDATTYPGADPDDVGRMVPQIYGTVKRSPLLAVDAGGKTSIVADMTATNPGNGGTLEISDASAFPETGAFIVQIDGEQLSIASRSGDVLTLAATAARGHAGTDAVAHDAGTPIVEIQTEFVYIVADHAVESIPDVFVDNVRQTQNFTAYTGKSGDEFSGYSGKAVVVFDTLPAYQKQTNLEIEDTIDVDDSITVDQGSHQHGKLTYTTLFAEAIRSNSGVSYPERIPGNAFETQAFINNGSSATFSFLGYKNPGGTPRRWRVGLVYRRPTGSSDARIQARFRASDGTQITRTSATHGDYEFHNRVSAWASCLGVTWAEISAGYFTVQDYDISGNPINCCCVWLDVEHNVDSSEATGVLKSGIAAKIGTVSLVGNSTADMVIGTALSANVSGHIDDATGTFTGTPFALIERPDDISKHIIVDRLGLPLTRLNTSAYANAASFLSETGTTLGFVIEEKPNPRTILNQVASHGRLFEFWDAGQHFLVPLRGFESLQLALDQTRIDTETLNISYTDRVDVKNKLTAVFDKEWSGHTTADAAFRQIVTAESATSIASFGELQGEPLFFPFLTDATDAQSFLNVKIDQLEAPRLIVEFSGGLYLHKLQPGDIYGFDYEPGDFLSEALLGLVADRVQAFRVTEKRVDGNGAIFIRGVAIGIAAEVTYLNELTAFIHIDNLNLVTPDLTVETYVDGLSIIQHYVLPLEDLTVETSVEAMRTGDVVFNILTEDFGVLLTEMEEGLALEAVGTVLQENSDALLQETGDQLLTET